MQVSQQPAVRSYHRRVFAQYRTEGDGQEGEAFLLWDAIDTDDQDACSNATFNLHVLTQLGWPGVAGCAAAPNAAARGGTRLACGALNIWGIVTYFMATVQLSAAVAFAIFLSTPLVSISIGVCLFRELDGKSARDSLQASCNANG